MNFLMSLVAVTNFLIFSSEAAPVLTSMPSTKASLKTPAENRGPGKATAAITMTHRLVGKVAVGQPLILELRFSARQLDSMQLEVRPDEDLSGQDRLFDSVEPGETIEVNLQPLSNGRHYVRIVASIFDGEHLQSRAFSVPVQVGTAPAKSAAHKASQTADGELLIRMPAK